MTKEDGQMRKVLLQMGLSVDGIVAGGASASLHLPRIFPTTSAYRG